MSNIHLFGSKFESGRLRSWTCSLTGRELTTTIVNQQVDESYR